jgi:hypothetical protein
MRGGTSQMAFKEVAEGGVPDVAWHERQRMQARQGAAINRLVGSTLIQSWLSPVGIASPLAILVICEILKRRFIWRLLQ